MVFSLPGRTAITKLRCIFSRCLGYSRTINTRNLELFWYANWNQTLFELVGNDPRLMVAPQFPLYTSPDLEETEVEREEDVDEDAEPSDDQNEEEGDGDTWTDDATQVVPTSEPDFSIPDDEEDEEEALSLALANASFSTAATVPEDKALTRVTDFAILHVTTHQNATLPRRYEGYRILRMTAPLLLEEKRFPPRHLAGPTFDKSLRNKIREAQGDVAVQVVLLFRRFPEMDSVMAIAASGPYWSNTRFKRAAAISDREFMDAMRIGDYQTLHGTVVHTRWSKALRLDTYASNERFRAIHNRLVALRG